MRRLLITGGAGFIGANFVHYWLERHPADRVVVLDALTYAGRRANLASGERNPAFRFVHGDICDENLVAQLVRSEHIDTVVHFAAESHVDRSIARSDEFVRTNVFGTHALLKVMLAAWTSSGRMQAAARFHHVSTDEVYGSLGPGDPPFTERTPYSPNSPYAASKAASDHLVRAYSHTYGLPVTVSNCSNNYGPYHFPEKLIPLVLTNALEGRPLPVYGNGENVRDWLYVEDHCRAVDAILERGTVGEVYNVGGRNEWRNIDIARRLCSIVDRRFAEQPALRARFAGCPASHGRSAAELITFVTDRPGHDWRYAIDAGKIERELGFTPRERFESGIEKTVDWYLENASWWSAIRGGARETGG